MKNGIQGRVTLALVALVALVACKPLLSTSEPLPDPDQEAARDEMLPVSRSYTTQSAVDPPRQTLDVTICPATSDGIPDFRRCSAVVDEELVFQEGDIFFVEAVRNSGIAWTQIEMVSGESFQPEGFVTRPVADVLAMFEIIDPSCDDRTAVFGLGYLPVCWDGDNVSQDGLRLSQKMRYVPDDSLHGPIRIGFVGTIGDRDAWVRFANDDHGVELCKIDASTGEQLSCGAELEIPEGDNLYGNFDLRVVRTDDTTLFSISASAVTTAESFAILSAHEIAGPELTIRDPYVDWGDQGALVGIGFPDASTVTNERRVTIASNDNNTVLGPRKIAFDAFFIDGNSNVAYRSATLTITEDDAALMRVDLHRGGQNGDSREIKLRYGRPVVGGIQFVVGDQRFKLAGGTTPGSGETLHYKRTRRDEDRDDRQRSFHRVVEHCHTVSDAEIQVEIQPQRWEDSGNLVRLKYVDHTSGRPLSRRYVTCADLKRAGN